MINFILSIGDKVILEKSNTITDECLTRIINTMVQTESGHGLNDQALFNNPNLIIPLSGSGIVIKVNYVSLNYVGYLSLDTTSVSTGIGNKKEWKGQMISPLVDLLLLDARIGINWLNSAPDYGFEFTLATVLDGETTIPASLSGILQINWSFTVGI